MLPISLVLSLAPGRGKVFQTFKPQPSPEGKAADRKAGCVGYRRRSRKTELKNSNSQVSAAPREKRQKGCEGEQGWEESTGQAKLPADFQRSGEKPKRCSPAWPVGVPQLGTSGCRPLLSSWSCCKSVQAAESAKTYWIIFLSTWWFQFCVCQFSGLLFCLPLRQTLCWGKASAWLEPYLFQLWLSPS